MCDVTKNIMGNCESCQGDAQVACTKDSCGDDCAHCSKYVTTAHCAIAFASRDTCVTSDLCSPAGVLTPTLCSAHLTVDGCGAFADDFVTPSTCSEFCNTIALDLMSPDLCAETVTDDSCAAHALTASDCLTAAVCDLADADCDVGAEDCAAFANDIVTASACATESACEAVADELVSDAACETFIAGDACLGTCKHAPVECTVSTTTDLKPYMSTTAVKYKVDYTSDADCAAACLASSSCKFWSVLTTSNMTKTCYNLEVAHRFAVSAGTVGGVKTCKYVQE
jgi:hypothetical protein